MSYFYLLPCFLVPLLWSYIFMDQFAAVFWLCIYVNQFAVLLFLIIHVDTHTKGFTGMFFFYSIYISIYAHCHFDLIYTYVYFLLTVMLFWIQVVRCPVFIYICSLPFELLYTHMYIYGYCHVIFGPMYVYTCQGATTTKKGYSGGHKTTTTITDAKSILLWRTYCPLQ